MFLYQSVDAFIIDQQIRGNADTTIDNYRRNLGYFMDYIGKDIPITEITLNSLKSYYLSLSRKNLSSVTIQTYIRAVRVFLSWLWQEGYMQDNLSDRFRLPKAKRHVIDVLTDDEIQRLLKSFDTSTFIGLRNICIVMLMLDSGLRLREVVFLKRGAIHIAEGYMIVLGKGNKERYVPLGLQTKKYLLRYMVIHSSLSSETPLFEKDTMIPIEISTVKQMFRKLKKRTGIERLHPHLLRHTFATRYLENGGDIYSLQMILGHTSLEMVKRYVHMIPAKTAVNFSMYSPLDNIKKKRLKP